MYSQSKVPSSNALRKGFKIPTSTKSALNSPAASLSRVKSIESGTPMEKGKGRARDSGIGMIDDSIVVWRVQWREPQTKKNKSWDDDGFLIVRGDQATLRNESHKGMGSGILKPGSTNGTELRISGKDVILDSMMSHHEYLEEAQDDGSQFNAPATILRQPTPSFKVPSSTRPKPTAFKPLNSTTNHSQHRSVSKLPTEKVLVLSDGEEDEIENSPPKKKRKVEPIAAESDDEVVMQDPSPHRVTLIRSASKSKSSTSIERAQAPVTAGKNQSHRNGVIVVDDEEELDELELPSVAQERNLNVPRPSQRRGIGSDPIVRTNPDNSQNDMELEMGEKDLEVLAWSSAVVRKQSVPMDDEVEVIVMDVKGKGKEIEKVRPFLKVRPTTPAVAVILPSQYYTCTYRRSTSKKGGWDGDGVIIVNGNKVTLKDVESRKDLGTMINKAHKLYVVGEQIWISGREIEIESLLSKSEYETGSAPTPAVSSVFSLPGLTKSTPMFKPVMSVDALKATTKVKVGTARFDPKAEGAVVMRRPDAAHAKKHNRKNLAIVDVVLDPLVGSKLRPHQIEGVKFMYECVMGMRGEGQGCILADEMGLGKTIQAVTLIWTLLHQNPYGGSNGVIYRAAIICPVTLLKNWSQEISKWLPGKTTGVFVADQKANISSFVVSKTYKILIIGYEKLNNVMDALKSAQPPIGLIICDEGHRLKSAKTKLAETIRQFKSVKRIILSGTPIQNDLGEFHAMVDFVNPGTLDTYSVFKKVFESAIVKSREPNATKENKEVGFKRSEQLSRIAKTFILRRTGDIIARYLPPKLEYVIFIVPTKLQLELYAMIVGGSLASDIVGGGSGALCLPLMDILRKLCNTPGLLKKMVEQGKGADILTETILKKIAQVVDPNDFAYSGKLLALGSLLKDLHKANEEKIIVVSNFTSTLDIIEQHCKKNRYPYCRLDGKTKGEDRMPMVGNFNKGPINRNFIFLLSSKSGGTGLNLIGASRLVLFDSDWNPSIDLQAMARIHREGQKKTCVIYRFLSTGTLDEKIFQRQVTKVGLSESLMDDNENGMGETGGSKTKAKSNAFSPDELRSVFRLHTGTTCQTHELLGCHCHLSPALIAAMAVSRPEGKDMDDDDSETSSPVSGGFVPASAYQGELPKLPSKDRKNLSLLKEWIHHNCTIEEQVDQIEDELIREIVYARVTDATSEDGNTLEDGNVLRGGHISFAFSKRSG